MYKYIYILVKGKQEQTSEWRKIRDSETLYNDKQINHQKKNQNGNLSYAKTFSSKEKINPGNTSWFSTTTIILI